MFSAAQMVTMETPTRNFVLGRKVLDTGFFHPIPVSDDIVPVNLGKYEITSATLAMTGQHKGCQVTTKL